MESEERLIRSAMDTMTFGSVCLLILGEGWKLLHLYKGQVLLIGKITELFHYYTEVQMCIEVVHRSWVANRVNCASYQSVASQHHICCFILPYDTGDRPYKHFSFASWLNVRLSIKGTGESLQDMTEEGTSLPVSCVIFFQWLWLPVAYATPNVTHPQVFYWHLSRPASACQLPSRWLPTHQPWYPWEPSLEPQRTASCEPAPDCDTTAKPSTTQKQLHALQWGLNFSPKSVPPFGILPRFRGSSCSLPLLFRYSLETFTS